jgi:hypothetical protein
MPAERIALRHVRDVLRLKAAGVSGNEIARRLNVVRYGLAGFGGILADLGNERIEVDQCAGLAFRVVAREGEDRADHLAQGPSISRQDACFRYSTGGHQLPRERFSPVPQFGA